MKVKLNKIKTTDFEELHKITSDKEVMKYIADGKVWTNNKTKKFLKYSIEEQNNNNNNKSRTSFFYKITLNKKLIGIIGIHKYKKEKDYSLRYFLNTENQGKGYGTQALKLILHKIKKIRKDINKVFSQVLFGNIGSEISCKKVGFIFQKNIKRSGKKYKQFIYYFKLHTVFKLEYPYLQYFMTLKELELSFDLLHKYKPIFKKGSIKKFINNSQIIIDFEKERKINKITDYFTNECRVKCIFKNYKSPFDYYKYNKGELIKKLIIKNKFNIDKFENVMYNSKYSKFCNNFQTTIAFTLYKLFKAKNIFDSSAGWGDRLVAAIAYGASYTGVDPSNCLEPLYTKIINKLTKYSKKNSKKYKIIKSGIEDVKVKNNYYDLCLTSPPFFDLETYENTNTQSISKYSTATKWEKEFLIILVEKNIKTLKKGGHLILYIPGRYNYFMNYMKNHTKIKYCGIFSFLTPVKRDIYIWKKL